MWSLKWSRYIGLASSYLRKLSQSTFGVRECIVNSYKLVLRVHICYEIKHIWKSPAFIHYILYFHCPLFFFSQYHSFLIFLSLPPFHSVVCLFFSAFSDAVICSCPFRFFTPLLFFFFLLFFSFIKVPLELQSPSVYHPKCKELIG